MDGSNRRIVLLGKTGSGKSSLANTIFGEEVFTADYIANSETRKCRAETRSVNGRSITLIDTPGFFDTFRSEDTEEEIVRCIIECAPGPHAFLIVLKVERFTEQEQAVIEKILVSFSEEVLRYSTVVFTHGDQLPQGQTTEDFFRQNEPLSDLVRKCGGRCHVIDNKYWNQNTEDEYRSNRFHVERLLNTIEETLRTNNERYYTNEMFQVVEEEIQREEDNIKLSQGDLSEEEIRQRARGRVFKKLGIKLAGIGTGVVLGALCGLVVPIGLVVITIKTFGQIAVKVAVTAIGAIGPKAALGGAVALGGAAAAAEGAAGGAAAGVAAAAGAVAGGAEGVATAVAAAGAVEGAAAAAAGGGTAAVTGAAEGAVAAGAAAAGGAAAAITAGTVLGVCVTVGAVTGGVKGYRATDGADTAAEGAKRAAKKIKNDVKTIFHKTDGFWGRLLKPRSRLNHNE